MAPISPALLLFLFLKHFRDMRSYLGKTDASVHAFTFGASFGVFKIWKRRFGRLWAPKWGEQRSPRRP